MTTTKMATTTIQVEIRPMTSIPELFAPAVVRGATVHFDSGSDPGDPLEVEFTEGSPFEGPDVFSVFLVPVTKEVSTDTEHKGYPFRVSKSGAPPVTLLLTVKSSGVDKVGFSVKGTGTVADVITRQWAPKGPLEIVFEKSVEIIDTAVQVEARDRTGTLLFDHTIGAGVLDWRSPEHPHDDNWSISLSPASFGDESGGTQVVDIIVENP